MTSEHPSLSTERPEKIDEVARRLNRVYGPRPWHRHHPPLDELIMTILSQHTSDTNTERAYRSLRARFPTWEAVRVAPTADVAHAIRSGGLAAQKAPRIQAVLDAVLAERGALDLDHLASLPLPDAKRWLTSLHGVGPKTAACVLLFSLGRPALPVDTHVHRVARRLGLIASKVDANAAHELLEKMVGDDHERVYAFHVTMIAHGRAVCTARRPFCERCMLTECCDFYADVSGSTTKNPTPREAPPSDAG